MLELYNKQKAQVSAPFELLVAIIVMGFVILSGTYALNNLSENTCLGNKRQDFSELISALRDVVLGSDLTYRNITFSTKACFNTNYEKIQLNTYDDAGKCGTYCGGGNNCLLLEYIYIKNPDYDEDGSLNYADEIKYPIPPVCTHLPSTINFASNNNECGIQNNDEWIVWNPYTEKNIPPGKYRLFKSSSSGSANTIICMLQKKRGY
jgi:uncharacterized protein (UPF0333 family)